MSLRASPTLDPNIEAISLLQSRLQTVSSYPYLYNSSGNCNPEEGILYTCDRKPNGHLMSVTIWLPSKAEYGILRDKLCSTVKKTIEAVRQETSSGLTFQEDASGEVRSIRATCSPFRRDPIETTRMQSIIITFGEISKSTSESPPL